jgi:gamma-butyrobetaine dioxygenase
MYTMTSRKPGVPVPGVPSEDDRAEALPYGRDAVAVRRWDDEAKDPSVAPPEFGHFEPLLISLSG